MRLVEVFSRVTPRCSFCELAKALLLKEHIDFTILDVTNNQIKRDLKARLPEVKTIPQIFVNGVSIGGWEELEAHHKAGTLHKLLEK